MSLSYQNLDKTKAGKKLLKKPETAKLKTLLTAQRVASYTISGAEGWQYNYAAKAVDDGTLALLADLAREQQVIAKYRAILDGAWANVGENRMVLHHLTRGQPGKAVVVDGRDFAKFYADQNQAIAEFRGQGSTKARSRAVRGRSSPPLEIGIGGSGSGSARDVPGA